MTRARRLLTAGLFTAGVGTVGCYPWSTPPAGGDAAPPAATQPITKAAVPVEIGGPLYAAAKLTAIADPVPQAEPIVIPDAVVQSDVRIQLPAAVDGIIELVGVPAAPDADPKDPLHLYHPRDAKKTQLYRKLRENDVVHLGQTVCRQDEQLIQRQIEVSEEMLPAFDRAIEEGKKALASYTKLLEYQLALFNPKGGGTPSLSPTEIETSKATVARLAQDVAQNDQSRYKVVGELAQARVQLTRFWVKSPVNGRVFKILKSPGEFAKAGDVIMEIQATDRIRVEGRLDAQHASRLKKGQLAYVEPTLPVGPAPYSNWHRQEVTGLAVTAHPGRPMIVSGGLDAAALVWDVYGPTRQSHRLSHPVPVRAVAATGPAAKGHWLATGGDDGKVRLWDLSNPDKMPKEPAATFDDAHGSAVTSAAFSPDGRYLATAAGREVHVWDAAGRKKLYALPADFRDAVTALRFTPQATLVTAARDKTVRVWKLGEAGAAPADPVIDHRAGTVDLLGVSTDGTRVLFDKDGGRLDVVSLADGRTLGTIENAGGSLRFANLALFSPSDHYVLTACGDAEGRGELQLWDAPAPGGRGSERRRLVTPGRAAVTCAAFSPDPEKPFVAVGTQYGGVHYWTPPGPGERGKRLVGRVESWVPADARTVQVRVVMDAPADAAGDALLDRSTATVIIPPEGVTLPERAAAPVQPVAPAAAVVVPDGGRVVPAVASVPAAALPVAEPTRVPVPGSR